MTGTEDISDLRGRLQALLSGGSLSAAVSAAGTELLARIDAPARVTLFGLPGSGRSRVLNLLAGETVIPNGFVPPTLQLRHGEAERTLATLADGSKSAWPGLAIRELIRAEPVFVELEAPLAPLRRMSILEIGAEADPQDQRAAMRCTGTRAWPWPTFWRRRVITQRPRDCWTFWRRLTGIVPGNLPPGAEAGRAN
jgi:hypothetical protein